MSSLIVIAVIFAVVVLANRLSSRRRRQSLSGPSFPGSQVPGQQLNPGDYPAPGPYAGQQQLGGHYPAPVAPYLPPGQFQPGQFQPGQSTTGHSTTGHSAAGHSLVGQLTARQFAAEQFAPGATGRQPPPPPPPSPGGRFSGHRPPQHNLPAPRSDIETQVRDLMAAGNEVGAVRLLCDEQDLGIIEAQEYSRSLVGPSAPRRRTDSTNDTENREVRAQRASVAEEETRSVGSAAFAESVFDNDADDDVWASGWTEQPDADDRTDIEELWRTVQNQGRQERRESRADSEN